MAIVYLYMYDLPALRRFTKYTDAELLALMGNDSQAAFAELYERYWKKLFAIAYNRLQQVQAAEDVVHDVFVSLWAGRFFLEIASFENYMATAVKYAVFHKIKKLQREKIYLQSISETPVIEMPVETSLHYKRILEIIKSEVEKLPEKCRLIFKYSRNDGMPVKQIAATLNISPKTVENQLSKALKQLKRIAKSLLALLLFFFFQ
jgi:RNA polymerase sigma-70 factor (family 1)